MATTSEDAGRTTSRLGLFGRVIGILTAPGETFARIVQDPRPFPMLLVIMGVSAIVLGVFFSTEVGQQAWMDEAFKRMSNPSPQQQQGVERMAAFAAYFGVGQALIGIPLVYLVMSGILFAVFNGFMGGTAKFKQLFSVIVHGGAVSLVQQLVVFPLNYFRESMSGATNLAVFLPMLEENSFIVRLAGTIDLFIVWGVIVLAIGLSVLYRRKASSIMVSFFILYAVIALAIAALTGGGGS